MVETHRHRSQARCRMSRHLSLMDGLSGPGIIAAVNIDQDPIEYFVCFLANRNLPVIKTL